MVQKLNIEKKFLFVIISSVIVVVALLSALVIRRETALLLEVHRRNARIVTATISMAIKDNMLAGRPNDTDRLINSLRHVEGVKDLTVVDPNGDHAFGVSSPGIRLQQENLKKLSEGFELNFSLNGQQYFLTPLINESPCQSCHSDKEAIRGAVVVAMSGIDIAQHITDLVKRMSGFGLLAVLALSAILSVLSRKMLLSPLEGLTEAADRMARGDFILHRPRGVNCQKILKCDKTTCPSYENFTIPCWLQTGTLCTGKPTGHFALKFGDCFRCRVYRENKGDEIVQLNDNFNRMILTMQKHEKDTANHINEIDKLNQALIKSNTKLSTLLDASRLTASTLELQQTLSMTLRIILDVTDLKAGVILLLEEDRTKRCHEYFDCKAQNCPAYRSDVNCWRLSGTMCCAEASSCPDGMMSKDCRGRTHVQKHSAPSFDYDGKFDSCSHCSYFENVVLIPKMATGVSDSRLGQKMQIDSVSLHKALLVGRTMVNYSKENPFNIPIETTTEIAMPLKAKGQITGILYLASDVAHQYNKEEIEFFQFLSEIISSGIFNSSLFEVVETSYFQTVMALSNAIEAKDPYTRGHSERVADLSMRAADALNLSKQEKEHLRFAAILHDVGKIGIGRDLLWKNDNLDLTEKEEIRSHSERGVQILEPIHFLKPSLAAIRHHHEKYDGSGYPVGLSGREIPFKARIICVADAWDAMLSKRPYRDPLPIQGAREELKRNAGTQFDPEVVDCFLHFLPKE